MLSTWNQGQSQWYSPCGPSILMLKLKLSKKSRNFPQLGLLSLSCIQRCLSNIVPVKKNNRQIRCCIDFRNLNKACLKDEFPLPNMDMLIDSTAGHAMFSFMDGFSGYNQIRMSSKDAAKTAFRLLLVTFITPLCPSVSKMLEPHIKGL